MGARRWAGREAAAGVIQQFKCAVPHRLKSPKTCSGEIFWLRQNTVSREEQFVTACLDKFDGIGNSSLIRKLSHFRTK